MPEIVLVPSRDYTAEPIQLDKLTENSMKRLDEKVSHIIDLKSRSQGIVLDKSFKDIERVVVKLISSDLPDQVYYDLSGDQLQVILQERYKPLADNVNFNAVIPVSLVGNLHLTDESYVQITITLKYEAQLAYDRIITAYDASNPLVAKKYDNLTDFDTNSFDELFFVSRDLADISFYHNGKRVHLPQILLHNARQKNGFASQKVLNETMYTFSSPVDFIAVEY